MANITNEATKQIQTYLAEDTIKAGRLADIYPIYISDKDKTAKIKEMSKIFPNDNMGAANNAHEMLDIIFNIKPVEESARNILQQTSRRITTMLKSDYIKDEAKLYLISLKQTITDRFENFTVVLEEQKENEETSNRLENIITKEKDASIAGYIYVYTFSHYETYFVKISEDELVQDRTYYKVGKTEQNKPEDRITQQTKTAVPETPLVLRLYEIESGQNVHEIEKAFHDLLDKAGHSYARSNAGKEWFLTNLEFLDSIASLLKLKIYS